MGVRRGFLSPSLVTCTVAAARFSGLPLAIPFSPYMVSVSGVPLGSVLPVQKENVLTFHCQFIILTVLGVAGFFAFTFSPVCCGSSLAPARPVRPHRRCRAQLCSSGVSAQ